MEFEWDESKSQACFEERGFDFAYAAHAFFDPCRWFKLDDRYEYGEQRFVLMGQVEGRVFVLIYTIRQSAIRIISARKANLREIHQYENSSRQTHPIQ